MTVRHDRIGYYLDPALADEEGGRAEGVYLGRLAAKLQLLGRPADGASLPLLLAGVDPATGELLDPRHERVRVAAYDCTFAAPKSVSLLASLATRDRAPEVLAAHDASVSAVVAFLERRGALVCRGRERRVLPAEGVAAAAFLHRTSRANDPHLHTHVLVANLGADEGGHYSALDGRGLFQHAAAASALYRSHLRHEFTERFGLTWKTEARGFNDVAGLSRRAIEAFSTRRAEIEGELARTGRSGSVAASVAAHRTRRDKDRESSFDELSATWWRQGRRVGIASSQIHSMLEGAPSPPVPRDAEPRAAAEQAVAGQPGRFTRDQLLCAASAALRSGAAVEALEAGVDAVLASDAVVALAPGGAWLGASHQIPPPQREARYFSREVAVVHDANLAAMEGARPLRDLIEGRATTGVFRVAGEGAFEMVAGIAQGRLLAGQVVRGVAPGATAAAHLEGLTAIPATTAEAVGRSAGRGERELVVLLGASRLPPRTLQSLLGAPHDGRASLVLLEEGHGTGMALGAGEQDPGRGQVVGFRDALPEWTLAGLEAVGDTRVLRTSGPEAARSAFIALRRELEATGHPVVAVTAAPRLFGFPSTLPHLVPASLRQNDAAVVLALGPAALFGKALSAMSDAQRVHVVVAPRRHGDTDRAALLEIAQPRPILGRLGPVPPGLPERTAWRREATRLARQGLDSRSPHTHLTRPVRQVPSLGR